VRSSLRAWLLSLAVVGACGAALGLPAAGLGTSAPRCNSSQLALKFVGFQGATGHRYWQFAFKNKGRACSLRGYARVQLLGSGGHVITSAFHHETGFPVRTVVVAHGERAFVAYTYLDGGFCSSGQFYAPKARVFPPGGATGFVFNMAPKNMGAPYLCPGSEGVFPVTAKPGP
jgi:Protein of unknown function (DUF4232)